MRGGKGRNEIREEGRERTEMREEGEGGGEGEG